MGAIGFLETTSNNQELNSNPMVSVSFTNALCYGQTGTGKTSCFMLPNIKERMRLGHGVLVYDFKGNLHTQVKAIAKELNGLEDVYEIGKLWGIQINLLKNINLSTLENVYRSIYGKSDEPYWFNASLSLLGQVVTLLQSFLTLHELLLALGDTYCPANKIASMDELINEYGISSLSFSSLFSILRDPLTFSRFLKDSATLAMIDISLILRKIPSHVMSARLYVTLDEWRHALQLLSSYQNLKSSDETGGKYAVIGVLSSVLAPIAALSFFNNDEEDITELLENGKCVIVNLSSLPSTVATAFNSTLYERLITRVSLMQALPSITVFIDEAHRILNEHCIPDVDICRENKFEYIFATQGEGLLAEAIGVEHMEQIKRNIAFCISFKTNDELLPQTHQLKQFEYIDLQSAKKQQASALFYGLKMMEHCELEYQQHFLSTASNKSILIHAASLYYLQQCYVKNLNTKEMQVIDYIDPKRVERIQKALTNPSEYFSSLCVEPSLKLSQNESMYTRIIQRLNMLEGRMDTIYDAMENEELPEKIPYGLIL